MTKENLIDKIGNEKFSELEQLDWGTGMSFNPAKCEWEPNDKNKKTLSVVEDKKYPTIFAFMIKNGDDIIYELNNIKDIENEVHSYEKERDRKHNELLSHQEPFLKEIENLKQKLKDFFDDISKSEIEVKNILFKLNDCITQFNDKFNNWNKGIDLYESEKIIENFKKKKDFFNASAKVTKNNFESVDIEEIAKIAENDFIFVCYDFDHINSAFYEDYEEKRGFRLDDGTKFYKIHIRNEESSNDYYDTDLESLRKFIEVNKLTCSLYGGVQKFDKNLPIEDRNTWEVDESYVNGIKQIKK